MLEEKIRFLKGMSAVGLVSSVLSCGSSDEPYGCIAENTCVNKGNYYECTIDGRYYEHPTGILVRKGDTLEINSSGEIDWGDCSADPEGSSCAWGLWIRYGSNTDTLTFVGKNYATVVDSLKDTLDHELYLIIPDGSDETYCPRVLFSDNDGSFLVKIKK